MSRSNTLQLSSQIREEALRLGFFKVGIASAGPSSHEEYLNAWLEKGFHGEMRYMERQAQKRRDPRTVLAERPIRYWCWR